MKKMLLILGIYFLIPIFCNFSQEYVIETSKGPQKVIIPEGMTLEDAYKDMAKLYLEERYDLEILQTKVDDLLLQLQLTLEEQAKYELALQEMIRDYQKLRILYEKKDRRDNVQFLLYGGAAFFDKATVRMGVSIYLFQKLWIGIDYEIPKEFGFCLGIRLN